ncbi:MAG: co-chaperone DjlA [Mariprofundus sp.]|nr:co-chaperone DjlA [Mariprofundus sp.]
MSLFGAGIGAGIGAIFGGPIGAGIGGWLGHSVSKKYAQLRQSGPLSEVLSDMVQQKAQRIFFVTLFSMLAKMAKADGQVSSAEAVLINHLARTQIKMNSTERRAASEIFNKALADDTYSIFDYAKQYRQITASPQMCEMVYRLLFAVAYADGDLHPAEEAILTQIPAHLGLDQSLYQHVKNEFQRGVGQLSGVTDLSESYQILGCKPSSSDNEVKTAYRKLCKEYHPDKISAKGLPAGFMKFAEQQMHQINSAYKAIMDQRKT